MTGARDGVEMKSVIGKEGAETRAYDELHVSPSRSSPIVDEGCHGAGGTATMWKKRKRQVRQTPGRNSITSFEARAWARCSEYAQSVMPFSAKIAANADVFASSLDVDRPQVNASCHDASPVVAHRVMVASLSCVVNSRDNYLRSDSITLNVVGVHGRVDAPRI
jgi:hypothetical protein